MVVLAHSDRHIEYGPVSVFAGPSGTVQKLEGLVRGLGVRTMEVDVPAP